jgi:hypothetical protein
MLKQMRVPTRAEVVTGFAVFLAFAVPIGYFTLIFNLRRIFGG